MNMQSTQTCATAYGPNIVSGLAAHAQDVALLNDRGKRVLSGDTELELKPAKRASVSLPPRANGTYCEDCNIQFSRPYTFRRHREDIHGSSSTFSCHENDCSKTFTRRDTLARHKDTQHGEGKVNCPECGGLVRKDGLHDHIATKICYSNRPPVQHTELQNEDATNSRNEVQVLDKSLPGVSTYETDEMEVDHAAAESESEQTEIDATHEDRLLGASMQTGEGSPFRDKVFESPQISNFIFALVRPSTPTIVLDSRPPTPSSDLLSMLFVDDGNNAEDLAQEVQTLRDAIKSQGVSAQEIQSNETSTRSQFLVPVNRFYNMSLDSKCALCGTSLGYDVESVFFHAKSHLNYLDRLNLQCSICKVAFAFENDLRLHSSHVGSWSFCHEMPPVQAQCQNDWVAEAWTTARDSFVNILRRWESLQLHWYFAAIRALLESETKRKTQTFLTPGPLPQQPKAQKMFLTPDVFHPSLEDDTNMDSLTEMFSRSSLSTPHQPPIYARRRPYWDLNAPTCDPIVEVESPHCADVYWGMPRSSKISPAVFREACWKGDLAEVKRYLDLGVDIDATDSEGYNALICATNNRQIEVAKFLVKRGANVQHTCEHGRTALHYACGRYLTKIVDLLVRKGAQVEAKDYLNETPLIWVASVAATGPEIIPEDCGSFDRYIQLRLRHSSNPVRDNIAALDSWACRALSIIIQLLLTRGADINAIGSDGRTALIHATRAGQKALVKVLLERGADMSIKDIFGRTAFEYATGGILKLLPRTRRACFFARFKWE